MANEKHGRVRALTGFLTRLRKDARGNTLAIVAAAMIPLIAIVGSGIDISRMYLVKSRLQQACDAGALAGRKQMGGGIWAQNTTPTPDTVAQQFFLGNFKDGAYGTTSLTKNFSENSGDVSGTATVVVPMTMMKFFGMADRTMTVTCDAQMQLPNTDVMFVLDNTGSMASPANTGDTVSKIDGLKNAVKCFYESVAQLKTNGTCDTTTSGTGVNSSSQIRFGFVPYTTNVNVGRLLPTSYFANSWQYQSREPTTSYSWGSWQDTNISCKSIPANTSTTQYQAVTNWKGQCKSVQMRTYGMIWHYGQVTLDISGLKNGSAWNNSVSLPLGTNGTKVAINWDGCIEERKTQKINGTPTLTINAQNQIIAPNGQKMNDLDIDMVPSQSDSTSLWAPALYDAIYTRTGSSWSMSDSYTPDNYINTASNYCPAAAKKLQVWSNPAAFDIYVDSLSPKGNTYHDIGILWGARLMSPTGIFSSENKATPTGGQIQRHMIFMTDGDTQTSMQNYTAYGVNWFDQRETPTVNDDLDDQTNARFAALCTATKNKGITLWVISFGGSGIRSDTKARLQACATDSNHYFDATSSTDLNTAFQKIAAQITQLRLTK